MCVHIKINPNFVWKCKNCKKIFGGEHTAIYHAQATGHVVSARED